MLTLQINNIFTDIVGDLSDPQWVDLEQKLSFRPQGYQFSPAFNRWLRDKSGKAIRRVWDGRKKQLWRGKKRTYFPTGLISLVQEFCQENNVAFSTKDFRVKPQKNINISLKPGVVLRDYQDTVVQSACKKTRGIIQVATSGGKTTIGAGIISQLSVSPFIFFVTSIDLLTQAKNSFEDTLLVDGKPITIGQIGGGIIDIRDINVMTIQTAVRALDSKWDTKLKFDDEDEDDTTDISSKKKDILNLLHTAKGAMADECQRWRSETCILVARSIEQAYYTYALSATPYRDEGDDMLIQACFGKKCAQITASELIKKGWVIKPDIKVIHIKQKKSIFKSWQSIYKEQVVENEYYNNVIATIANSYINNGRLVLVLVKQIKHGQTLQAMIPGSLFLSGSSPKEKREAGIEQLRQKKISCILSTQIFDEGVNIQSLDTVMLCGGGKSKVRAMQRIGRIMRLHEDKTVATAIDFCIHQKYLEKHAKEREKMYRTEPEYSIEHIEMPS